MTRSVKPRYSQSWRPQTAPDFSSLPTAHGRKCRRGRAEIKWQRSNGPTADGLKIRGGALDHERAQRPGYKQAARHAERGRCERDRAAADHVGPEEDGRGKERREHDGPAEMDVHSDDPFDPQREG